MEKKLYTVREAARFLNYSERTIRDWCNHGKLDGAYRVGTSRKWQIPASTVEHPVKGDRRQHVDEQVDRQTSMQHPLLVEAERKHFEQIALLLETWRQNVERASLIRAIPGSYTAEGDALFPYVLQHCPLVGEKYQNLKQKRQEFEGDIGKLTERIAKEAPREATKWFSKVAADCSVLQALGCSSPSYHSTVRGNVGSLSVGDDKDSKTIVEGIPEVMNHCEELHKQLIRRYIDSPEVSSMANEARNLQAIQKELAEAIQRSQLRQEWVNNQCDCCPGKSVSYQQ